LGRQTDINEHLPVLKDLAMECRRIAEFGVRGIESTWALLEGLRKNNRTTKKLVSVDIEDIENIDKVIEFAKMDKIKMKFVLGDSAKIDLPYDVDMLFIDTWHIYGHLKRELAKHHTRVSKYIVMHDTEIDAVEGEAIRLQQDIKELSQKSGYPEEEISKGLEDAILEFIKDNPDWTLYLHLQNNCGLTILKRKDVE
jgi:nucleotide-binding universal stress UspA family protein